MDDLLKAADVAKLLNIGKSSVYKLVELNKLPAVVFEIESGSKGKKPRPCVRFEYSKIMDFIKNHRRELDSQS